MRTFAKNKKWIRLISGLFFVVLVAEFASHGAICAVVVHHTADEMTASQHDSEDPCQTLVLCSNNREKERQTASFAHDKVQHNGLIGGFLLPSDADLGRAAASFAYADSKPLFRPPDPQFRPPKLS
ncbi:MAG: hypothetical protein UZ17_ACD001002696 [Acidobacteria bacterium OLB17]|nr:MAG: hypothetical protein UZ17_ACD001002696 [Acidobacteria bacterium OLB17]MCZ2390918.1 hypothetical protein [Acidobacteriota bacterium]